MTESNGLLWVSAPPKKYRVIEVTKVVKYFVPIATVKPERTEINGWTVEQVIEDWFKRHDINQYHATRDSYRMGNSDRILDIKVGPATDP